MWLNSFTISVAAFSADIIVEFRDMAWGEPCSDESFTFTAFPSTFSHYFSSTQFPHKWYLFHLILG